SMNSTILHKDEENFLPNDLDNNSTLIDDSTRIIIDDSDGSEGTDNDGNDGRNDFDEADIPGS
ncbi:hypothetical protein L873DRAFT_1813438, partial [Choiromyces venosus 120613-1]